MTKRKVTKESKMRLICFGSICMLIIGYFVFSTINMFINIKNLSEEQQQLENNLLQLQDDEINLTKELKKLKNDEYKAKFAREYFLYSKDNGEYIFTTIMDQDDKTIASKNENNIDVYHYVIIGMLIIVLLLVLYIIRRIKKNK